MQRESNKGMRNYIAGSLARGYSLDQIKTALIEHGYSDRMADAIILEYNDNLQRKGKLISNNLLALIVIGFMLISAISNYYIISAMPKITGMISGNTTAMGMATMCVNSQPYFDISECPAEINVTERYYCIVNTTDLDWNYTNMTFTYYDNSTFFNLTNITNMSAEINFTTRYPDDLGGDNSLRTRGAQVYSCP